MKFMELLFECRVPAILWVMSSALYLLSIQANVKSTPMNLGPWESQKQKMVNTVSTYTLIIFGILTWPTGIIFVISMIIRAAK